MNLREMATEDLEAELHRRYSDPERKERPTAKAVIDVAGIIISAEAYIVAIGNGEYSNLRNLRARVFEAALRAVYGNIIFPWITRKLGMEFLNADNTLC